MSRRRRWIPRSALSASGTAGNKEIILGCIDSERNEANIFNILCCTCNSSSREFGSLPVDLHGLYWILSHLPPQLRLECPFPNVNQLSWLANLGIDLKTCWQKWFTSISFPMDQSEYSCFSYVWNTKYDASLCQCQGKAGIRVIIILQVITIYLLNTFDSMYQTCCNHWVDNWPRMQSRGCW